MEKNFLTWYFLLSALLFTIVLTTFVVIVFVRFIKTKTTGLLLLTFTFLSMALAEILNTTGLWHFVFVSETGKMGGYLQISFTFLYALGYITLYYFANRHLLNDNDILKYFTIMILAIAISVLSTLMYVELSLEVVNPVYIRYSFLTGPNIAQILPSALTGAIIFIPIFIFVHVRIIISTLKLQKDAPDEITKTGLRAIMISNIGFVSSALFASLFIVPTVVTYAAINVILHTLRIVSLAFGVIHGFYGWVYPAYVKEKLKQKRKTEDESLDPS